jgi:hypothetical protein
MAFRRSLNLNAMTMPDIAENMVYHPQATVWNL